MSIAVDIPMAATKLPCGTVPNRADAKRRRRTARSGPARDETTALLAQMSHELKTPLGAVLGFVYLMANDESNPLTKSQRRRVALIEQAGQHMLSVITDVMNAAITASRPEMAHAAHAVVELAPLVHETLQWMQPTAERHGVRIVGGPITARVRGNALSIRQILLNLVSNATKYNHCGGHVQVHQIAEGDGGCVGIEVSDTGHGMSEEMQARLFRPFDRLGEEAGDVEGTGVGLCIVREQVERLGGRIEVRSRPGVGSVFTVWLKRA